MPKKTKRQKIAAQLHKKHITYTALEPSIKEELVKQPTVVSSPTVSKKPIIAEGSTVVFKSELKKSIIISVVLILLEIGIYIGQTKGLNINTILPF